jgi:pilus assembly protein CpaB
LLLHYARFCCSLCAVLLFNALDIAEMRSAGNKAEVSVVKVSKSIPAMTILTEDVLTSESVKVKEAPQGSYTNPIQVIGKVLSKQVVEGQVLTSNEIVRGGSSAELAATLPDGMRAVSVTLSGSQITGGMLYPGCVVDILVAFKMSGSEKGEALSTTMLERITVLAVQGESVVAKSNPEEGEDAKVRTRRSSRGATVTLMVDTKQAEALQLAAMNGQISVTLRNPSDTLSDDGEATVLNRGKLGRLGSPMGTTVKSKLGASGDDQGGPLALMGDKSPSDESNSSSEVMVFKGSKISYVQVEETEESEALSGTEE